MAYAPDLSIIPKGTEKEKGDLHWKQRDYKEKCVCFWKRAQNWPRTRRQGESLDWTL